eukprot:11214128-Lingulodinium_polyedra.AAC.1
MARHAKPRRTVPCHAVPCVRACVRAQDGVRQGPAAAALSALRAVRRPARALRSMPCRARPCHAMQFNAMARMQ